MLPKIEITYSGVYDRVNHYHQRKRYGKNQEKLGKTYAKHLQKVWDKKSRKILAAMSRVSGLKWKYDVIKVYPVKYGLSEIAWPLTIFFYKNDKRAISILIHELSHVLMEQNRGKIKWRLINRRYGKCSSLTRQHLLTHAICMLTAEKVFKGKAESYLRFERFWEWDNWELSKHYKKSWEIVTKKGPKNIIKELVK